MQKDYSQAMKAFIKRKPRKLKITGKYPSREELHERYFGMPENPFIKNDKRK